MRVINRKPDRSLAVVVAILPFVLVLLAYAVGSAIRLEVNPADKLLPAPVTILDTAVGLITEPDKRSARIVFWNDTLSSLARLGLGVGIAALGGLVFGMVIGLVPILRAAFLQFVTVISMVPPLAVLPILFIILGLGEVSKVALIVIGVMPFLIRDTALSVAALPRELIVKAETLGASSLTIALRVALPQVLPRLIQSVRLALGPAWLFLIAAEAIASESGLGYRIFLVRRYLAMDVILTYVVWITLLSVVIDRTLLILARRAFPWAGRAA